MKKKQKNNNLDDVEILNKDMFVLSDNGNLDSELREKGIYYIAGEIDNNILIPIQQDILLKHLSPNWKEDIQLVINSPGGSASSAWSLIDLLNWVKMDVRTIGMGECCSAGAMLIVAGTKGKRVLAPNSSIMFHAATWFQAGNKDQLIAQMQEMGYEHDRHIRFYLRQGNFKNEEEVETKLLGLADHWMKPEQVLELGLVDYINVTSCKRNKKKSNKKVKS